MGPGVEERKGRRLTMLLRICNCLAGQASSIFVKANLMRSMSESCPLKKSCHGGMFLKAVIAKLSERVKATNGKPCFEAGLNSLPPTQ